jgi:hypothetical protein
MLIHGPDGNAAEVTNGRLLTSSSILTHIASASLLGNAYTCAASVDVGADKNVIWLRNDSQEESLIIDSIIVSASAATTIEVFVGIVPATSPTPGTIVLGTNMNIGNSNIAPATCYHTETSVDAGAGLTLLSTHQLGAVTKELIDYKGALVLPYYGEVAVNVLTDIALTSVNILGFFI